jgi:hypothetical protein
MKYQNGKSMTMELLLFSAVIPLTFLTTTVVAYHLLKMVILSTKNSMVLILVLLVSMLI